MDALKSICDVYADTDSDEEIRPSKRLKCSESMNPGHHHHGSTSSSPPTMEPSQPPSMDSIKSIIGLYAKIDPVKQIEPLIRFVENHLQKINTSSEAGSSPSEDWLETFPDSTDSVAKTVDTICSEAEKLSNSQDAVKEIGSVTLKVMKEVGESHWVFMGLSVATYAVENYVSVGSKVKECRELLLNILRLAKDVKPYSEQKSHEKEKLCNVVACIVEATVIFCNNVNRGSIFRCWSATTATAQLEKTTKQLKDVRDSLRQQTTIPKKYYGQGKDVFLSHSGKQKKFVRQLHRDLTAEGVSCFFDEDEDSLPKGHEFPRLIFEAAETCKIAVLVLSEGFIRSKWPMLELSAFVRRAKSQKNANLTILPVFFKISAKELANIQTDDSEWQRLEVKDDTRREWQDALKEVRKTNGLLFVKGGNEVELRDKIRERVRCLLQKQAAPQLPQLDFKPEGIEDQTEKVKQLLDIGGTEAAIAVVIVGLAGIGKSTLAASVIQSLNLSSTGFKFSRVIIDERIPDKISHIIKLQTHIISDFRGVDLNLQGIVQGREQIQKAMAGQSCFLYIDNVVDRTYVKELLPTVLLPKSQSAENPENEMQNTKTNIRIFITSRQNNLNPILNIKNFVHHVQKLSDHTANKILKRTILGDDKPAHDFDEGLKINELAKSCKSVPLLLSVFGNHLKDKRDKDSYDEAIKALNEGDIDPYGDGDEEEQLSEILMYVYNKMKDEEAREAFLDICTYFHGWKWNLVADIEDNAKLEILQKKMLVNKSEAGTVIVHDILRLMGEKKAKGTRLMTYEEFFNIKYNDSKLENIKGMVLKSPAGLITLKTRHFNAIGQSLRFLALGDWVRVKGHPCHRAFENLRYLEVGELNAFPFQDVCRMKKLNVFFNRSKPGMELAQLPPNLKYLSQEIPYQDCNEIARLPLQNLKSLKTFIVKAKRSVRLPQRLKLPSSLEQLVLNRCEQLLPETFSHLSALQSLALNECELKGLPQEFTQSVALRSLSMQHCTNLISLPDNIFGSLCSLRDLNLKGCTGLQKLPADLGTLTALQNLNIEDCESLRVLPENFGRLETLKALDLHGCLRLQRLPDSFGMLRIEHLSLYRLHALKELPESMGDLSCLKQLEIRECRSLEFVPDSVGQLANLEELGVGDCEKLGALPKSFEQLSSLKEIRLCDCPSLRRLPDGLQSLKSMWLRNCSSVVHLSACFEMLSSLETLSLDEMPISSLPDGLGKLKNLKRLYIWNCFKFQTFPQGLENLATLETLSLWNCPLLEGTTMNKIVKLQNCRYVNIEGSTKLIERWREMEESKILPIIVQTSSWFEEEEEYEKEFDRGRKVGLVCGKCIQLDTATTELIHHPSLSIPNNTTLAVISLHVDQPNLFQQTVEMAQERARTNCGGRLRIIYVCRPTDGSDAPNEEDETEKIRQALTMLPEGISYAIPSTDSRRLSLIRGTIFNYSDGPKLLCFVVDVREDNEGRQIWKDGKRVTEDEISKKFGEKVLISENSDEEIESFAGIVEFINCICESQRHSSSLPMENMVDLIQKLNKKIHHFTGNKVKVDLQGKTVAIILIDRNDHDQEFKRLQQIYLDIKLNQSNFEAVWITLREEEYKGYGSYSRATLADPKSIKMKDIKDKSPRVIIINSEGSVGNPNALSLLMG